MPVQSGNICTLGIINWFHYARQDQSSTANVSEEYQYLVLRHVIVGMFSEQEASTLFVPDSILEWLPFHFQGEKLNKQQLMRVKGNGHRRDEAMMSALMKGF